jgi:hypothetical protein
MSRRQWIVWSWDERSKVWMEVAQGSEADMQIALDRKQSAAARLMPSARFTMTPKSEPPQEPPDELGESRLSGTRAQDRPGYQELVDKRTRKPSRPAEPADFTVKVEWHSPDAMFAAAFLRGGKAWTLDGALVGMGTTRAAAVEDLCGIARHLVIEGSNFLTEGTLLLNDRAWLFKVLAPADDEMRAAMRVFEAGYTARRQP